MSGLIKRDNNELRYNAVLLLEKEGNSVYYKKLFRNTKFFFYGLGREDLIKEMENIISEKVCSRTGKDINEVLSDYEGMVLKGRKFVLSGINVESRKYLMKKDLEKWLDEVEDWIMRKMTLLESHVRFTIPPKQWV